jgi:hypothetical protein
VTTQSPHLYARRPRSAAGPAGAVRPAPGTGPRPAPGTAPAGPRPPAGAGTQTRLPWWAVAPAALAFAALLALLTAGTADASAAAPSGDWLGRAAMALPDLIRHLL